jgi:glutamyl/glutaminyl-tRNA synthetase
MIVNAQGKPYSKRDGAAFVGDFRAKGYLPDALQLPRPARLVARRRQGVMTRDEMVQLFTLDRVQVQGRAVRFQEVRVDERGIHENPARARLRGALPPGTRNPRAKEGVPALLASLRARFAALPFFDAVSTEAALREEANAHGLNAADLIHPLRVTVSGLPGGPSLFHMLEVLGRDRVLSRLERPVP